MVQPLRSPGGTSSISMSLVWNLFNPCELTGGMIAPIVGGALLMIDPSFPVYASIAVFVLSSICVLLIEKVDNSTSDDKDRRVAVH